MVWPVLLRSSGEELGIHCCSALVPVSKEKKRFGCYSGLIKFGQEVTVPINKKYLRRAEQRGIFKCVGIFL